VTRNRLAAAGAAAGVLFLALRVPLLDRFPGFWDETLYAFWTWQGSVDPAQRFISLANGKEPLLQWIGMGWMALGAEPLLAVRLVSLAAGAVTLVVVGLLAAHLFGAPVGIAAAAVCAVLPFFVVHDVIGIYEALATAAVTCALYLQVRLAREPRLDLALLLGAAFAAGLLTKQSTYTALALLPVSLLLFRWDERRLPARLLRWGGAVTLALVVAWLGYSLLRLSQHWEALGPTREVYPTRGVGEALSSPGRWMEENWPGYRAALGGYVTVPLLLVGAVGAGLVLRRRPAVGLLLSAWFVVPLAASVLLVTVPFPRYLLPAMPPLVVFVAYGLVAVLTAAAAWARDRRLGPAVAPALALLLFLPALAFDVRVVADPATARYPGLDDEQYVRGWTSGHPWPPLAEEVRERAAGRPTTVALGEFHSRELELLLRDEPHIHLVRAGDAPDPAARLGVENLAPLPRGDGLLGWRPVWRYERPRGGTPLVLYERGVELEGEFLTTPDELRAAVGGGDADFDAFVADHPEVAAWYEAWHAAAGG
jgi:hypothetical protein